MDEVDNLQDLFSLALVNRAAYTAFKTDELELMKATVRKVSPPAWELRQASEVPWDALTLPGGQSLAAGLYFRHYARDLCYVAGIKFLLEDYCLGILSEDLRTGLRDPSSTQAGELDAAVWRVWTFCHLFGNRKDREHDTLGQQQWLRGEGVGTAGLPPVCQTSPDPADFNTALFAPHEGFAQGNSGGLSQRQLMHMLEVWTSMGVLLDFLRKETRRARRTGLFEGAAPPQPRKDSKEEVRMLHFVLTLGPAAVLELAPLGPNTDPDIAFGRAACNGWTHWTDSPVGASRSEFLSGVVRSMLRSRCASDEIAMPPREILLLTILHLVHALWPFNSQ
ncbi:hypothetical protein BJY00DRAFT_320843 [Aspergillus carlsbadensis]|nr:hypothetical protein BJY00DRAFT_320843 [Aspergillus carlsbadensis]